MATYEYGRIRVLADRLRSAAVPEHLVTIILQGGEEIKEDSSGAKKADWMRGAMVRMNRVLAPVTRQAIRESCACCLGGKRLKISKQIARDNETLEERIAAANEARFVFGHSVTRQEDGQILVRFEEEGKEEYRCVCLPRAKEKISVTYCYCCGGHVKHHLQTALGRKLECTVRSSALSSGFTQPCTFLFRVVDDELPASANI